MGVQPVSWVCMLGHKIQVSFTEEQWKLIEKLKGHMGSSYADVVRNIILAWLSEKSIISDSVKKRRSG